MEDKVERNTQAEQLYEKRIKIYEDRRPKSTEDTEKMRSHRITQNYSETTMNSLQTI